MIYGDMILEQNFNKMTDPIKIMTEYYENEISFLNSVINYQNECTVTESYELETLHEGFIETAKNKIKELINKFVNWLKGLWAKFTALFKKKVDNAEAAVNKAKEAIKLIEHDSNLSKEEKEEKKQEVVDKVVKSSEEEKSDTTTSNKSNDAHEEEKPIHKDKKYRYYFIEPHYILSTLLFRVNHEIYNLVDNILKYSDRDPEIKDVERINRKIDSVKSVSSLEEAWEEFTKNYYYSPRPMTPDQILKQTEENIKNYKQLQENFEKRKVNIDKDIDKLRKLVNNIPKDIKQKNLTLCNTVINKYITANEKELSIATQFIAKLGSNLKVVEVDE